MGPRQFISPILACPTPSQALFTKFPVRHFSLCLLILVISAQDVQQSATLAQNKKWRHAKIHCDSSRIDSRMIFISAANFLIDRFRFRFTRLFTLSFYAGVRTTRGRLLLGRSFNIGTLCGRTQGEQLFQRLQGALIYSHNEPNLTCTITFQTDSALQHFLLRFEKLELDCHDHLQIFDRANAVGKPKKDLSCRDAVSTVDVVVTQGNHVTLKYTTDPYGIPDKGFRLIITAHKQPEPPHFRFKGSEFLQVRLAGACSVIGIVSFLIFQLTS
ncbi:unnamed protein product [Darwinula stevensoni]|uniref:CUB domain-containing protein n=1 Tax=Darwinula stevensoni TaxID=69355 RepID=A0A7R8X613_9CRUS|nr:unnamed protein product [Darwinula stevensoni]CAG0879016.1 unnamed protein product [Darwinula stevensoni]